MSDIDWGPIDCWRVFRVDGQLNILFIDTYDVEHWNTEDDCASEYFPQRPAELPPADSIEELESRLDAFKEALKLPIIEIEGMTWRYDGIME